MSYLFNRRIIRSNWLTADVRLLGLETSVEVTFSAAWSAAFALGTPGSAVSSDIVGDVIWIGGQEGREGVRGRCEMTGVVGAPGGYFVG